MKAVMVLSLGLVVACAPLAARLPGADGGPTPAEPAACKLRDLKTAGWQYIAFGLLAPNIFATIGIVVAHTYSWLSGTHVELGTYVLFSVLCGAASYIAVPAVQRLAIPEASPTLPLAASLGLTFSYNVTIGIPVYMEIAKAVIRNFPLA